MTQDDIIRMAREAGVYGPFMGEDEDLERFAQLVAEHERESCAKVCGKLADQALVRGDDDALTCFEEAEEAIRERGNNE